MRALLIVADNADRHIVVEAEDQRAVDGLEHPRASGLQVGCLLAHDLHLEAADRVGRQLEGLIHRAIDLDRLDVGIGCELGLGVSIARIVGRIGAGPAQPRQGDEGRRARRVGGHIVEFGQALVARQEHERPQQQAEADEYAEHDARGSRAARAPHADRGCDRQQEDKAAPAKATAARLSAIVVGSDKRRWSSMAVSSTPTEKSAMRLVQRAKNDGPSGAGDLMRLSTFRLRAAARRGLSCRSLSACSALCPAVPCRPQRGPRGRISQNRSKTRARPDLPCGKAPIPPCPYTCWPPLMCSSVPLTSSAWPQG